MRSGGADIFPYLGRQAQAPPELHGAHPPQRLLEPALIVVSQISGERAHEGAGGDARPVPAVEELVPEPVEEAPAGLAVGRAALRRHGADRAVPLADGDPPRPAVAAAGVAGSVVLGEGPPGGPHGRRRLAPYPLVHRLPRRVPEPRDGLRHPAVALPQNLQCVLPLLLRVARHADSFPGHIGPSFRPHPRTNWIPCWRDGNSLFVDMRCAATQRSLPIRKFARSIGAMA